MCFDNAAGGFKKYCFNISILVKMFFMPNSVILIALARFNFATVLSPLLSFFDVFKLISISYAIALVVYFSRISLVIFMYAISYFVRKKTLF